MTSRTATVVLVLGVAAAAIARGAGGHTYTIDSGQSRATIEVGKSGAFSFAAGHTHEVIAQKVAGTMTVDMDEPTRSTVRVTIDASSLKVTGKGESANDVPKVQETMMGPQVLDAQRFPTITFASTGVAVKNHTGATLETIVSGRLTLHQVTKPIEVPVSVHVDGGSLSATGRFTVKQTDYGIKPVSVGGVVSVKDAVAVSFTIVGR